jgi:hypothetical protein
MPNFTDHHKNEVLIRIPMTEVAASLRMFPDLLSLIARRHAPPPRGQPADSRPAAQVPTRPNGQSGLHPAPRTIGLTMSRFCAPPRR